MWWPAADEGDLRTAAQAWRTFASAVDDVTGATNSKAGSLVENNRGQSIDAFAEFWSRYYHQGHGWLKDLAESSRSMAEALDKYADAVAGAKKKLEHELEIVGATLVAGTALAVFTAGISEGAAAAAAAGITELASTLGVSVSTEVASIAGTTLATAAMGGIESVTVDLAVTQPVSIATGESKGFNLDEALDAGTSGALMGGALGGAGATAHTAVEAGGLRGLLPDAVSLMPKLDLEGLSGIRPSAGSIRPPEAELPRTSRPTEKIPCERDPVDVVTGTMLLPQTDVSLPGALPLLFSRTHLSTYGAGEWFGPSWASTLDERLQLDERGVVFAAADGMRLVYPVPRPDRPVLPEHGPRWPLEWDGRLGGVMTVTDLATGLVRTFSHPEDTGASGVVDVPLESVEDRCGNRIDFDRTPEGIPLVVHHSGGYHIAVETTGPRVTALRLGDEDIVRYGYDSDGNLAEVVNSSGIPLRFNYDKDRRITSWTDRNDTSYHYHYDDRGRVTTVGGTGGFLAGGFAYDEPGRTTTVTDSLGRRRIFRYDDRCKVVAETDPLGNTTLTEWDEHGEHPLALTDPLGRVTRYEYDAAGNLTGLTLPDGSTGRATYNAHNLPVEVIEPGGATWRHEYDDRGSLLTSTGPAGAITRYAYDQVTGHLTAVTDAADATRRIVCDPAGLPVAVTDPLGHTTTVTRDAFGRITDITDPLGHTTRLGWTPEGKPAWREHPDGARETWTWDGEGNLLTHTDPAATPPTPPPAPSTCRSPAQTPTARHTPSPTTPSYA